MGPKRKAHNQPKNARVPKKGNQMKTEDSASWKELYNVPKKCTTSKKKCNHSEEDNLCQSLKIENLSPELLDENKKTNKAELPCLELNRLLQSKSKLNLFGTISWKTFLFPSILHQISTPKKMSILWS